MHITDNWWWDLYIQMLSTTLKATKSLSINLLGIYTDFLRAYKNNNSWLECILRRYML